jgi:hypothetical protein
MLSSKYWNQRKRSIYKWIIEVIILREISWLCYLPNTERAVKLGKLRWELIMVKLSITTPWRHMMEWNHSSTILDLGTRRRWVVSFRPLQLYPLRNSFWYPLLRKLIRPQSTGRYRERNKIFPIPGIESWFLYRQTHHLIAILIELFRFRM